MNVRRPECDEHPLSPAHRNASTNQLTMLLGRNLPPLRETITGACGTGQRVDDLRRRSARESCGWIGTRRPRFPLETTSRTSKFISTFPFASRTMSQVSPAISHARSPARTESKTITLLRRPSWPIVETSRSRLTSPFERTLACFPSKDNLPFNG